MRKLLYLIYAVGLIAAVFLAGCASKAPAPEAPVVAPKDTKFSDNPNYGGAITPREYKRTTRQKLEDESDLGSNAGSLWVMEGQGSYLFAQNKTRREGDLMNVKLEGPAQKQVETKVTVIKKLLKRIEEQKAMQQRGLASDSGPTQQAANPTGQQPDTNKPPVAAAPAANGQQAKKEDEEAVDIPMVPTRITERMADGNFRVKGSQPFMIGKREYKVIVTGIIRPEDFNDEGVSANKLLDPQFDVVSIRKKTE